MLYCFRADVVYSCLSLKRRVDQGVLKEIVEFTGGNPAYMNWLGEQCCRIIKTNEEIPLTLIKELEERIFEINGLGHVFDEDLRKVSLKKSKLFRTFIEMASHNLSRPSEIVKFVPKTSTVEVIVYLNRLEKRGFVRRISEGKYTVIDTMLSKYISKKIHVDEE